MVSLSWFFLLDSSFKKLLHFLSTTESSTLIANYLFYWYIFFMAIITKNTVNVLVLESKCKNFNCKKKQLKFVIIIMTHSVCVVLQRTVWFVVWRRPVPRPDSSMRHLRQWHPDLLGRLHCQSSGSLDIHTGLAHSVPQQEPWDVGSVSNKQTRNWPW